jgi:hypothetical protein
MSASTVSDDPSCISDNLFRLLTSCPSGPMLSEFMRLKAVGDLAGGRDAYVRRLLRLQARVVARTVALTESAFSDDEATEAADETTEASDQEADEADEADAAIDALSPRSKKTN